MLPLTYCYAFVNQWLWAKKFNRRLIQTHGFSRPDNLRKALLKATDAMICMVGAQVPMLIQQFKNESFPGITRLHFAGGRFPQEHLKRLKSFFPNSMIFNNYGCAEAMPRLTIRTAEQANTATDIGYPLPGVRLKTSENGELLFYSPYSSVAFIDEDGFHETTDKAFTATGDFGVAGKNGRWSITGRSNEVFKRYGEKIALPQVIQTLTGNWDGNIASYRDKDSAGEDGYVLVLSPEPSLDQVREILKSFRANFPRTHWPLRIESTESLPLLSNGKIDYLRLAKLENKNKHWRQRL
jgi:acyl-CoA synthetase (AMP-forming)/AMP-acid ligase II